MTKLRLVLAIFVVLPILVACDNAIFLSEEEKLARAVAVKRDARKAELEKNRAIIVSEIEQLVAAGKAREAIQRAAPYRQFSDPGIEASLRQAQIQANREQELELLAKIKATKPSDRQTLLSYYSALEKLVPENGTYKQNWKRIQLEIYRQNEADKKKELAAERAKRRSEGVSVGMTKQEVLMSSWGRPQHVNSTTTTRGTTEQWVYGGRNYLYFDESGRLTTIQN
ncbi:MAG: hypothetical protein HYY78_19355 [Betaproteobacteria bacterium]|nr:hypothetical protein [Betaproteobacteria bacterium]